MKIKSNRVFSNAGWMIAGKIIQSVLAFLIGVFTARFLGPSNYGLISYAASITTFILPVVQLGLNAVIVYEIVNNEYEEGKIIGTSMVLSVVSAFLSIIGIFAFSLIVNRGEKDTIIVCLLYSLTLIFQALYVITYWFQSKLLSKYTAVVIVWAYIFVSCYRVFLLVTEKNVYWFSIAQGLDYLIISFSLIFLYKKLGGQEFAFSWDVAKRLICRSKYYIISGIMFNLFVQTDKIMLKMIEGNSSVGVYSVAVSIAGILSFVFSALIDSFRPSILEKKKISKEVYEKSIIDMYAIVIYAAVAFSLAVFVFSKPLIQIMYGEEYYESIMVLRIIVWYMVFTYFGGATEVWILAEGKQKYLLLLNLLGAVFNIILNFVLIYPLGVFGAAIASLLTKIFVHIVMCYAIKPLRYNIRLLIRSLNPKNLITLIKSFVV